MVLISYLFCPALALGSILFSHVRAHTYLLTPDTARPQKDTCSPEYGDSACCAAAPGAVKPTHGRGEKIKTEWGRNNHWGGYIRWTILKTEELDKWADLKDDD